MTGLDLRLARVRAGLTINETAARVGVTRETLRRWEQSANVPAERAVRYLQAIEQPQVAA